MRQLMKINDFKMSIILLLIQFGLLLKWDTFQLCSRTISLLTDRCRAVQTGTLADRLDGNVALCWGGMRRTSA